MIIGTKTTASAANIVNMSKVISGLRKFSVEKPKLLAMKMTPKSDKKLKNIVAATKRIRRIKIIPSLTSKVSVEAIATLIPIGSA